VRERQTRLGRNARRRLGIDEKGLSQEDKPSSYDRNAYDASIASQDAALGELFAELERRGILENTIVVITSDHGEQLGEHGLFAHGNSLYMQNLHVPLVVVAPGRGVPAGRRVEAPVTLRSLAATVLDLAGAPDARIPGASMAVTWRDGTAPADQVLAEVSKGINSPRHVPVTRGDMKSLLADGHHYIRNFGDGREELYDLGADPGEENDLAREPRARERLVRSRDAVERIARPRSAAGDTAVARVVARTAAGGATP
jgi:arylsulfatase A-like enzyme